MLQHYAEDAGKSKEEIAAITKTGNCHQHRGGWCKSD
jgi:hypothetical protein